MTLEQIQSLVGRTATAHGLRGTVGGVHVYINHQGAMSIRLHLLGIDGYFRLADCIIEE